MPRVIQVRYIVECIEARDNVVYRQAKMEMETEDDVDADPPSSAVPLVQSQASQEPDIAEVGSVGNQELVAS